MLEQAGFATEAAYFASIAEHAGVDREHILIEDRATNSGENIAYTKELLAQKHISAGRIIVVVAPYSERRQQATYAAQWPGQEILVTSPQLTLETYPTAPMSMNYLINALVGRVQRMEVYSQKGFQAPVTIPGNARQAYERLVELGFVEHLV